MVVVRIGFFADRIGNAVQERKCTVLVIHWAKHNITGRILKNGIRPSYRRLQHRTRNTKGVYVFPWSRVATVSGNWRRNLKVWDGQLGNYNGFIFRLNSDDFPVVAGAWYLNRLDPTALEVRSLKELAALYGAYFSGIIVSMRLSGFSYDWTDFEIIIPRAIDGSRIIRVVKDRNPKRRNI